MLYTDVISFSGASKCQKVMKIVTIKEENFHIFIMSWGISIKFSDKMWLMTLATEKITFKQLSLIRFKSTPGSPGVKESRPKPFFGFYTIDDIV